MRMLLGCRHCGRVVRRLYADDLTECSDCGRVLAEIGPEEANILALERRVADQFRRVAPLRRPRTAPPPRRALG
jgi:hypothetical protein